MLINWGKSCRGHKTAQGPEHRGGKLAGKDFGELLLGLSSTGKEVVEKLDQSSSLSCVSGGWETAVIN